MIVIRESLDSLNLQHVNDETDETAVSIKPEKDGENAIAAPSSEQHYVRIGNAINWYIGPTTFFRQGVFKETQVLVILV